MAEYEVFSPAKTIVTVCYTIIYNTDKHLQWSDNLFKTTGQRNRKWLHASFTVRVSYCTIPVSVSTKLLSKHNKQMSYYRTLKCFWDKQKRLDKVAVHVHVCWISEVTVCEVAVCWIGEGTGFQGKFKRQSIDVCLNIWLQYTIMFVLPYTQ